MDPIMKTMLDMTISEDIEKWLLKNANGNKINTENVYFAHTVYIDENQMASDEEFRILIDSSIITPHNKFFVDVINEEEIGIIDGWTGIAMISNSGRCVDRFEPLSTKYGEKIANFDEIKEFVNEQNRKIRNKRVITSIRTSGEFDTRRLTDEENLKKMNKTIGENISKYDQIIEKGQDAINKENVIIGGNEEKFLRLKNQNLPEEY